MTQEILKPFLSAVVLFYVLYIMGYSTFLFLSVTVGSATLYGSKRRSQLKNELEGGHYVPVTVVVPAHNESVTIESSVRSQTMLDYHS